MSTLTSPFDLEDLRPRVEQCLRKVDNVGPASTRFCSELKILFADMEHRATNTQTIQVEMANLQNRIAGRKRDIALASIELQTSNTKVETLRNAIDENQTKTQDMVSSNQEMKSEIKKMMEENECFQAIIDKGAGWSQDQKDARDEIVKTTEKERANLDEKKHDLIHTRQQITRVESNIEGLERGREQIAIDLRTVQDKIDTSNDVKLTKQAEINHIEKEIGDVTLQLQEAQDQVQEYNQSILRTLAETKKAEMETKDIQAEIDKNCRDLKESGKQVVKVSIELEKQHQKNIEMEHENVDKVKVIQQKKTGAKALSDETVVIEKKKQLLSEKLVEVEKERIKYEGERENLKLKLNKIGSVELKMMGKEMESQKRQIEGLEREMQMLDRKGDLTDKNSTFTREVIATNETTLLNLQNEVGGLCNLAKECKKKIEDLHAILEKERQVGQTATAKRNEAIGNLREQDAAIESLQKELDTSELQQKQNQDLCDSVKKEFNLQARNLAENHEELEAARRELAVIAKQINSLRVDISHTENNVIMEHYNHYHTGEEKSALKSDLENLKRDIGTIEAKLGRNRNEVTKLDQHIDDQQKELDSSTKEYSTLVGNRDLLGSLLVQKKADLEKIQEQIKSQQSLLHQSEIQYSALISSITEQLKKFKDILYKKQQMSDLDKMKNELEMEARSLEHEVHKKKIKTIALREELGRPINIHRWRSLEHTDPQKYEKIQNIQRLQKQIIVTTEHISEQDMLVRDYEREYLEVKRITDHQPQMQEVKEQLELFKSSLSEKMSQMKEIEIEIVVQKRRVKSLNADIESLEQDEKQFEEDWVREVSREEE